jgi:pimeloyl-ACP methyl ester carboxylesterase
MMSNNAKAKKLDWIVVPGGPGLSSDYLRQGLSKLQPHYKLHFYEPYGSPNSSRLAQVTIADLINQILEVADQNKLEKFGLITHSFGSYLAMRLLQGACQKVTALIMLSPMPLVFKKWQNVLEGIGSQIPAALLSKMERPEPDKKDPQGIDLFNELMPYYTKRPVQPLSVPFNISACNQIADQVCGYDNRELMASLQRPWKCLVEEQDPFFTRDDILMQHSIVIPEVGHYSFLEDETSFVRAFKQLGL